ncbi:MAG TPA: hypothetical protein VFT29_14945 [Gemmatimonadaceae bacterium]|nr:hypothetical protein [Gemmatimonadaceae bacterium]
MHVTRGARPSLVVWYKYNLPFAQSDSSSPEGRSEMTRIAQLDSVFVAYADSVAAAAIATAGVQRILPVSTVLRTRSWKELTQMCRTAAQRT